MRWRVILASRSPRRSDLLAQTKMDFIVPTLVEVDEGFPETVPVREVPSYLAKVKANAYGGILRQGDILLTADTVVILEGRILGKPIDRDEAIRMLSDLSGKRHSVVTGVVLRTEDEWVEFSDESIVKFGEISKDEIEYYVDNCNPYDKAGGYGIQDWIGAIAVEGVEGSFYNVVGLPIQKVYREICKIKENKK